KRLQIDRLVVSNHTRICLGKERLQRLQSRDARAIFCGTCELRLRPGLQRAMNSVGKRKAQRLRGHRNCQDENEQTSTAHQRGLKQYDRQLWLCRSSTRQRM